MKNPPKMYNESCSRVFVYIAYSTERSGIPKNKYLEIKRNSVKTPEDQREYFTYEQMVSMGFMSEEKLIELHTTKAEQYYEKLKQEADPYAFIKSIEHIPQIVLNMIIAQQGT